MGKKAMDWEGAWNKIFSFVEDVSLPIVCIGKGKTAFLLANEQKKKIIVVDRDFDTFHIDAGGVVSEVWGDNRIISFEVKPLRIIADFHEIEFKNESIGALFVTEIFLMEKKNCLKFFDRLKKWIIKGGIVVISTPTTSDIRFKNFKLFGSFWESDLVSYQYRETIPGGLVVNPPVPCDLGCDHKYFSFYNPREIRQKFSDFKTLIAIKSREKKWNGEVVTFLYGGQKI